MNRVDLSDTRGQMQSAVADGVINQAKLRVESGFNELRGHIQGSSSMIRTGSFVGGLCVVLVALLNVINPLRIVYDSITYLVNCYQLLFGLVTLALEGKPSWFLFGRVQEAIYREAHCLSLLSGRALFYLFEGSLFVIQEGVISRAVGIYMALLGLVMLYQGGRGGFGTNADDSLTQPLDREEEVLRSIEREF